MYGKLTSIHSSIDLINIYLSMHHLSVNLSIYLSIYLSMYCLVFFKTYEFVQSFMVIIL